MPKNVSNNHIHNILVFKFSLRELNVTISCLDTTGNCSFSHFIDLLTLWEDWGFKTFVLHSTQILHYGGEKQFILKCTNSEC